MLKGVYIIRSKNVRKTFTRLCHSIPGSLNINLVSKGSHKVKFLFLYNVFLIKKNW